MAKAVSYCFAPKWFKRYFGRHAGEGRHRLNYLEAWLTLGDACLRRCDGALCLSGLSFQYPRSFRPGIEKDILPSGLLAQAAILG